MLTVKPLRQKCRQGINGKAIPNLCQKEDTRVEWYFALKGAKPQRIERSPLVWTIGYKLIKSHSLFHSSHKVVNVHDAVEFVYLTRCTNMSIE